MGRTIRTGCMVAALMLIVGSALAHAMLAKATPAVGSTIRDAPTQVVLEFTERIEPTLSTVQVADANGNLVSQGTGSLTPGRAGALTVTVSDLRPGAYIVTWKAVSVDMHVTRGSFSFTLLPR